MNDIEKLITKITVNSKSTTDNETINQLNDGATPATLQQLKEFNLPDDYLNLLASSDGITFYQDKNSPAIFAGKLLSGSEALDYYQNVAKAFKQYDRFPFFNWQDNGLIDIDLKHANRIYLPYEQKAREFRIIEFLNFFMDNKGTITTH